jgi:methylmalonyl-CoA mutase N-terminal domain/subunit
MRDRFGARSTRSQMLRFHVQTGGATLTAQQPENNIVRAAYQALAAVLGGAQSLHVSAMDEALALPSEMAARIALRTQHVLAQETGVTDTVDPLGGSYYVEALTDQVEAEAKALIAEIDARGGALAAIEQGYQQTEIHAAAYRYQKEVEDGRRQIIGVNAYVDEGPVSQPPILRLDTAVERKQIERVRALRARRDSGQVEAALRRIEDAAQSRDNLMPPFIAAVEKYATVGEICDVLRRVWGEQPEFAGF